MNVLNRRRFAKALPTAAMMAFLLGLLTLLFVLPWEGPGSSEVQGHPPPPTGCGVERWSVKTGTDPDAHSIDPWLVHLTSVTEMGRWPQPHTLPPNNRIAPYEFYRCIVDATLVEYVGESDRDYHLVLQDHQGNRLIGEIPDPACVGANSPFAHEIANARAQFNAVFHVTSNFQYAYVPVTVTGVAFFDFAHGQTGHAPNYVELHPVLDIQFDQR